MKLAVLSKSVRMLRRLVGIAPPLLAGVALYDLFLIVIPFFVLGVNRLSTDSIYAGTASYELAFGVPTSLLSLVVLLLHLYGILSCVWLACLLDLALSRKWYVLLIVLLAPIPIAYLNAGPYSKLMTTWVLPL